MSQDFVIVIPVRLKSTRLENKPLLDICGKSMIERTFRRAEKIVKKDRIIIATDSKEIEKECLNFSNNIFLTSTDCLTGTDRIAELIDLIDSKIFINIQGDEPIMPLRNIELIAQASIRYPDFIINGYSKIKNEEEFNNFSIPKAVISKEEDLLYMSRSPIPGSKNGQFYQAFKQICLYSYPKKVLERLKNEFKKKTFLENIEDIEILRFLENGIKIKMIRMSENTVAVDTPEDLTRVRGIISSQGEDLEEYSI